MSKVKEDLLKEIDNRIQKKKQAKERAKINMTVEGLIISFIKKIEELDRVYDNDVDWGIGMDSARKTLADQLKIFDPNVKIKINWRQENDCVYYSVDSVTVSWSDKYQKENNVDPELTLSAVDIALLNI